jgi:hypothetical protein
LVTARETGVKIMNVSRKQISREVSNNQVTFEALESREMMSVSHHRHHAPAGRKVVPPVIVPVAPAPTPTPTPAPTPVQFVSDPLTIDSSTTVLQITGTAGNDQIAVSQSGNVFTITNGSWSTTVTGTFTKLVVKGIGGSDSIQLDASVTENADLYGGAGNDTIFGGSGNDRIFAGAGSNVVNGGAGDDTIITVGSASDTVTGGLGNDSYWLDSSTTEVITDVSSTETAAKHVHRIGSFIGGVSKNLTGGTFAEPAMTDPSMVYNNFSNLPLFGSNGPSEDDITQGYIGDCWYLSSLSSVAKVSPDKIRQSVVDFGDGTYGVQFTRSGQNVFARVDGNLPYWYNQAAYANVINSQGNSTLWVAIMEKAMTEFTGSTASYKNIDGGWMSTAYDSMGLSSTGISGSSASDLANQLSSALAANKAVTLGISSVPAGAPLLSGHAYTVDHVNTDAQGNIISITLRNPWGVDGAGNDGLNDGYVTVTLQQAYAGYCGAVAATV